jgi:hypothetical protein
VHASKGFDRMVDGKLATLPSVDWFAKAYSGTGAAVAATSLTGTGDTPTTASSQTELRTPWNTPVGTPNWKDRLDAVQAAKKAAKNGSTGGGSAGSGGGAGGGGSAGAGRPSVPVSTATAPKLAIAGAWLWAQNPTMPSVEDKVGEGMLLIADLGDGTIAGTSLLEVPLNPNPAYASKAIIGMPLRGTFNGAGGQNEESYTFLVTATETGQVTENRVVLSADRNTLRGKAKTKTASGILTYEWTAIRMPKPEQK